MKRTTYSGAKLNEISFPLGGIGSGSIGLAGNGGFVDWEIFNRPSKGSENGYTHFAVKAADKATGKLLDARVLCGDKRTGMTGRGMGLSKSTMAGFPHFEDCVFSGEFPIAKIDFADSHFPGSAALTAFNPLIPRKEDDSSLPAAFFELALTNTTSAELEYTLCFSVRNPYDTSRNSGEVSGKRALVSLTQEKNPANSVNYGELCVAAEADGELAVQEYWYRGRWSDDLETYWRNFTELDILKPRSYDTAGKLDHCSVAVKLAAKPGETVKARFILCWYVPNNYNYWKPIKIKNPDGSDGPDMSWKNYYAVLFPSARACAEYALDNWDRLYGDTDKFRTALFSSTLPEPVIEAASATLSVLKSSTVLRLENGALYGWEGTWQNAGSCEGSCTHVWNYAYAAAFLFPGLERSLRELDFDYNLADDGRMSFRLELPLGRTRGVHRACVDGQMGGVIKSWREWKISGDDGWLAKYWPKIKKSLEYAWSEDNCDRWDRDADGVLEGRQHHTLDMELFGPSSWLEGFYLAALKAGAEMAEAMGEKDVASKYLALFKKGSEWSEKNLFNGSYYVHKLNLADKSVTDSFDASGVYWNDEAGEIKYQIGEGCEIDQLCAQWHANVCGLGEVFDRGHVKTALRSLYKNNFKRSMREFYNPWRIFAVNDESGAVICDYPEGARKPAIPVPYCQESMHGFEYQLACLMISEGMLDEGIELVTSIRDRYDGEKRNPWNEIECGNNYARSMASYSLIPVLSGFTFDMTKREIGFAPMINKEAFRCVWSLDCAWGTVSTAKNVLTLEIADGALPLSALTLPFPANDVKLTVDGKEISCAADGNTLRLSVPISAGARLEAKKI